MLYKYTSCTRSSLTTTAFGLAFVACAGRLAIVCTQGVMELKVALQVKDVFLRCAHQERGVVFQLQDIVKARILIGLRSQSGQGQVVSGACALSCRCRPAQ